MNFTPDVLQKISATARDYHENLSSVEDWCRPFVEHLHFTNIGEIILFGDKIQLAAVWRGAYGATDTSVYELEYKHLMMSPQAVADKILEQQRKDREKSYLEDAERARAERQAKYEELKKEFGNGDG